MLVLLHQARIGRGHKMGMPALDCWLARSLRRHRPRRSLTALAATGQRRPRRPGVRGIGTMTLTASWAWPCLGVDATKAFLHALAWGLRSRSDDDFRAWALRCWVGAEKDSG
jgi:hypothetical protein